MCEVPLNSNGPFGSLVRDENPTIKIVRIGSAVLQTTHQPPWQGGRCGVAPCGAECRSASRARRPRRPGGQAAGAPRPRRAGEKEGGKLSHKELAAGRGDMAPQYQAPAIAQLTAPEPCRCCCSRGPSSPPFAPRVPARTPGTLERKLHSCCSCCTPTVSESDRRATPWSGPPCDRPPQSDR